MRGLSLYDASHKTCFDVISCVFCLEMTFLFACKIRFLSVVLV